MKNITKSKMRYDIWRVEVFSILICLGIISRSLKDKKLSRFNNLNMFNLVNVEDKLISSLHSETFHGTIASINLPQFRQCPSDIEEDEEKS